MSSEEPLPPLPVFAPQEPVCGNCKLWQAHSVEATKGWVGPCRVQPGRGLFPPSAPKCNAFVARGSVQAAAPLPLPVTRTVRSVAPRVFRRNEPQAGGGALNPLEGQEAGGELEMTRDELLSLIRDVTGDSEAPALAQKWEGGTLRLLPGSAELQPKDVPIDALFHKVVMVRDRLRTLEQKINGHPKLSDAEKIEMQHYITRVYGSLTTFNVLFRDREAQFVGAKGEE